VQHRQADRSVTPITMASFVGVAQPR
jgi:hypothetical protein